MIRAHIIISGRVQGVFFRKNTQQEARRLGLTGWVRNLLFRKVEVLCEGEKEQIERFVEWLREGPRLASVKDVAIAYGEYEGLSEGFDIKEYALKKYSA